MEPHTPSHLVPSTIHRASKTREEGAVVPVWACKSKTMDKTRDVLRIDMADLKLGSEF